tara:strand:- start:1599 stop:2342 length:744 start_codon:yes stop_codon:yes gene_type:complete
MSKVGNLLKADTPYYKVSLPLSGKDIQYRPFRVKEEKILLMSLEDGSDGAILLGIKNLLNAVVESDDFDAGTLPILDMEFLFINVRAKSIGEVCTPTINCPHTGETVACKVDLTKVKKPKTDKIKDPKIKLSDSVGVTMKIPTLNSLIENDITNYQSANPDEIISLIGSCIDEIWTENEVFDSDNLVKDDLNEFIESMSIENFDAIGDYFESIPVLSHTVKYSVLNPETQEKENHQITLNGLNDFFV